MGDDMPARRVLEVFAALHLMVLWLLWVLRHCMVALQGIGVAVNLIFSLTCSYHHNEHISLFNNVHRRSKASFAGPHGVRDFRTVL